MHGRRRIGGVLLSIECRGTKGTGRRGRSVLLGATLCASVILLSPKRADAYHDEKQRITDRTAYTMPQPSFRIGIFRTDFGIFDPLTVRTYFLPWLVRMPNVMLKWRFYGKDPWAFAIDTGFYALNTKHLEQLDEDAAAARIIALPIELISTYRFSERHNLSGSALYTAVNVEGTVRGDDFDGAGKGALENAQLIATYQFTLDRVAALQLTGRMVVFQRFEATADVTYEPDEYTTVEVFGGTSGETDDLVGKGSIQADIVFSWKRTNLRLGLGYGHYTIPGINFVLPRSSVYPSFDLHWIF